MELSANDLPIDDLDDPTITLVGAFDGADLIGVIGLQACDGVRDSSRSRGIARALCEHVVELARARRFGSLWLLTTSARDYFTRRGFEAVDRATAPDALRTTAQFASLSGVRDRDAACAGVATRRFLEPVVVDHRPALFRRLADLLFMCECGGVPVAVGMISAAASTPSANRSRATLIA